MSRFRILFLFAALTALATAFAACGDSGGSGSSANPQTVVDNATLQGIESGNLDLSLGIDVQGDRGGSVDVSLSGPFQSQGGGKQLPQLDMTAKAEGSIGGDDVDFEGGLVLLADRAYVNYQGTDYEVDPTTFSFVKSAIQQAQQQNNAQSQVPDVTACQNAVGKLQVNDFVDNLTNEGTTDVGGAGTTHVSGDLNVGGAIDALVGLMEDPACASQLGAAGPLPSEAELRQAQSQVESALKTAQVDVYVGDDDIVRRVSAELKIEPPRGEGDGTQSVTLTFDLTIEGVNEEQTIEAPSNSKPLNALFMKLGVNPIELLGTLQGQGGAGVPGLDDILGGLGSAAAGGSGSGGSGSSGGGGGQQAYLDCLKGATTPVDLQNCAKELNK